MNNEISFSEALAIIDKTDKQGNAYPFDVSFRTLQRNSKSGGRLVEYKQVRKSRPKNYTQTNASLLASVKSGSTIKRDPNHSKNRTRLLELQNGDKKKIHIRLIDTINGKKMHY
ncbi:hypothetical protein [Algibacter sp. PT7-4]|uniref:hypothetical protein n=1 Tax=Algibacter ulvanivorans TaxID=3400999 RepID=UPI003AAF396B